MRVVFDKEPFHKRVKHIARKVNGRGVVQTWRQSRNIIPEALDGDGEATAWKLQ